MTLMSVVACLALVSGPVAAQGNVGGVNRGALVPDQPSDPRPHFADYERNGTFDEFAWDLFLYINWPAKDGVRGQPDPNRGLGDRATTTWETWKDLRETLPADGSVPAPWSSPPDPTRGFYAIPEIDGNRLLDVKGQPVLLGLRSNRSFFEYVVGRGLWNADAQIAFAGDPNAPPIDLPSEAMEIKSSWLILDPDLCSDTSCPFHVQQWCRAPDNCISVGLVGLHIMSKVQDDWFWTSFEHIDNQKTVRAPETVPIKSSVATVNAKYQEALAETVWANYRARGAQWTYLEPDGSPSLLSNTTIETGFQKTSSCITCHALASRGNLADGFIPFFKLTLEGVGGYIGDPDWRLFCAGDTGPVPAASDPRGEQYCAKIGEPYRYRSTDFAWIFRLAVRLQEAEQ